MSEFIISAFSDEASSNIDEQIIQLGSDAQLKKECSKMVLSAKDYGVPQNRPRIYIVLWRKDLAVDEFECEYRNKDKKEFMKYVGKVYYMKFRCEEIYERLKEIEEEVSEIM